MLKKLVKRYKKETVQELTDTIPAGTYLLGCWNSTLGIIGEQPDSLIFFKAHGIQTWDWYSRDKCKTTKFNCIGGIGIYPFDPDKNWNKDYSLPGILLVLPNDVTATAVRDPNDFEESRQQWQFLKWEDGVFGTGWHYLNIPEIGKADFWGNYFNAEDRDWSALTFKSLDDWSFVKTKKEIDYIIDCHAWKLSEDELNDWKKEIYKLKQIKLTND